MKIISELSVIILSCIAIYYLCIWLYKKSPCKPITEMPYCKYDDELVTLFAQVSNATTNFQLIQITKKIIKFQNDYDIKNDIVVQADVSKLVALLEFKEDNINNNGLEFTL